MADVVSGALADMDIEHIPAITYSSEENGITERFNRTVMNAVRTALMAANISWEYWTWALQDAVDKYNHIPHRNTGCTPQEACFREKAPDLRNLYIFGQVGFAPIMNKAAQADKHKDRGKLVDYLGRDCKAKVITETTHGTINRYRGSDFHAYFSYRDPVVAMKSALTHDAFNDQTPRDSRREIDNNEQPGGRTDTA